MQNDLKLISVAADQRGMQPVTESLRAESSLLRWLWIGSVTSAGIILKRVVEPQIDADGRKCRGRYDQETFHPVGEVFCSLPIRGQKEVICVHLRSSAVSSIMISTTATVAKEGSVDDTGASGMVWSFPASFVKSTAWAEDSRARLLWL